MSGRSATARDLAVGHPALLLVVGVLLVVGAAVAVPALTLPVTALVGLGLLVPLVIALARGAAWALPVVVGIGVLLADVGGRSLAPGPWRYVPTLVVILSLVVVGMAADDRSKALRTTAVLLFGYGLLGTLYGRFVLGTENGTLPLIGPMVIACFPPVRNWAGPQWRLGLRVVSAAATAFALGSGLTRLGVLPGAQIDVLNHEKAYLVVLAVAAALAARDRLLTAASLAAAAFAFIAYPAATYVLVVAVAIGTLVLVRWAPGHGQRIALAVAAMGVVLAAVLNIDRLIELTNSYFVLVGKQDNGNTREALYRAALDRLDHPLFSQLFTGDITVVGNLSGQNRVVPVHNDYLSISLGGGVVAAALLLALFLFANWLVLRALPGMTDPFQRRTAIVLLAAVNGAAVSAFANPIFMNPGASAITFGVLAALVAVCRSTPAEPAGP